MVHVHVLAFATDCPENSPNLPFHCIYVRGHLAAYFDAATDDTAMTNFANVIVNQISAGMDTDAFVDERAKLLVYVPLEPNTIPSPEESPKTMSEGPNGPSDNEIKPQSSSKTTYIGIVVGCAVASIVLLSLFVFLRRRRVQKNIERSIDSNGATKRRHRENLRGVCDTERASDGDDSYCIEVEVSDTETVAISVNKDGRVSSEVGEKADSQGTAATEDDCETIATQESGVTLYLDTKRVGSDISALTWYGPAESSNRESSGRLGQGLEAIAGMGVIQEDEEEEEEEDHLNLKLSTEEKNTSSGGRKRQQSKSTATSDTVCYSSTASGSRGIV